MLWTNNQILHDIMGIIANEFGNGVLTQVTFQLNGKENNFY